MSTVDVTITLEEVVTGAVNDGEDGVIAILEQRVTAATGLPAGHVEVEEYGLAGVDPDVPGGLRLTCTYIDHGEPVPAFPGE